MLSHNEMVTKQKKEHDLISAGSFKSKEEYVLHIMHTFAYTQAARLAENKKVLDLGCNTGYGTDILSNYAKEIIGVDVSEKAISNARNVYTHRGIKFQLVDGDTLPFEDHKFDMIVSFQVVEHIVDYKPYISELKRVLTPRGLVIFTTPNALLRLDPGMKPWNPFHVCEFSSTELKSLLSNYFLNVDIWGVFASQPLYSLEADRLNSAREQARNRSTTGITPIYFSLRSQLKQLLPESIRKALSTCLRFGRGASRKDMMDFADRHGVKDFYYSCNDIESALDLFAICADDRGIFDEANNILKSCNA